MPSRRLPNSMPAVIRTLTRARDEYKHFQIQRNLATTALTHTDTQREEAQALYPEAQALAVDLCDTVEFFYRHDPDPGSRRVKCERWGVSISSSPHRPHPRHPRRRCLNKLTTTQPGPEIGESLAP